MNITSKSQLFLIATVLPWIVLVVSPMTMYLGNKDQYGDFAPLLAAFLGVFLTIGAIFFTLLQATKGAPRLFKILCGLIVGLALSSWIQGQLFLWDFGPLDGRGLDWAAFEAHAKLEIGVWLVLTAVIVTAAWFAHGFFDSLPIGVWLLGLTSIALAYITSPPKPMLDDRPIIADIKDSFAFHKNKNSIIIVLDTYQSDAFLETLENHPEETTFLTGFEYYPNTIGGYPTTKHSIPLILTGSFYRNDFPYNTENQREFFSNSLLKYYEGKQYGVVGDFSRAALSGSSTAKRFSPVLRESKFYGLTTSQRKAIDIGLFRATPIPLKNLIYDENRWFLAKFRQDKSIPPEPHGADRAIVNELLSTATVNSKNEGEFKFLHLWGAHHPLTVDELFRYIENLPDTRESYVNQARGALHITKEILEKIKALGIYEAAEILVVSDHGAHNKEPIDARGDLKISQVPLEHIGAARPLFLYKPAGASGSIRTNDSPMHLSYIPCLLSKADEFECSDYLASLSGPSTARQHYRYEWQHDFWFQDFAPPMKLYEVHGDARDIGSWKDTMITFDSEGMHQRSRSYQLGERIDFGEHGGAESFLMEGWSHQESTHRWTDGPSASLSLTLPNADNKELILHAEVSGFSPDQSKSQSVRVLANGTPVAEWEVLAWAPHTARIPAEILTGEQVIVRFEIAEPKSPFELTGASDTRKLGIAVYALTLTNPE